MNKNHAISTRKIKTDHYQVVVTNVQSGKCLKVLCDMVREPEMSATEFEKYCEGSYQGFVNPRPLTEIVLTDFSHLHALEERAVRIRERMRAVRNNDSQWKSQATQLFQTEQEIADEREFLGLEDMDVDKLYAALSPEAEYDLPVCESCQKTLTIHDPIATDGQSLLCFKCEQLERCDACEHFHEMNQTCGKCGREK